MISSGYSENKAMVSRKVGSSYVGGLLLVSSGKLKFLTNEESNWPIIEVRIF
jgi:hypothetical protein